MGCHFVGIILRGELANLSPYTVYTTQLSEELEQFPASHTTRFWEPNPGTLPGSRTSTSKLMMQGKSPTRSLHSSAAPAGPMSTNSSRVIVCHPLPWSSSHNSLLAMEPWIPT